MEMLASVGQSPVHCLQFLRLFDRQSLEHDRVHQRKNGGIRADSQRQGENRYRGEHPIAPKTAQCIEKVSS